MPKYNCYVKMEVLCWIPDVEAENEKEAEIIVVGEVEDFLETAQCELCNDNVVEIESYNQIGDVEVYKQEEEE